MPVGIRNARGFLHVPEHMRRAYLQMWGGDRLDVLMLCLIMPHEASIATGPPVALPDERMHKGSLRTCMLMQAAKA